MKFTWTNRARCPVCDSGNIRTLLRTPFASPPIWTFLESYYGGRISRDDIGAEDFIAAACSDCELIFQSVVLDSIGMGELYENILDADSSREKRIHASHAYYAGLERNVRDMARFFPEIPPYKVRVLDFGMGWGHWVAMARSHGFDSWGAELSQQRRAYANTVLGVQVIPNLQTDLRFDFINAEQVFEHLSEPRKIVGLLGGLLKEGGILRISVPNGTGYANILKRTNWTASKDALHPLEHVNAFNVSSITRLTASANLERVALRDFPRTKDRLRMARRWLRSASRNPTWFFRKP